MVDVLVANFWLIVLMLFVFCFVGFLNKQQKQRLTAAGSLLFPSLKLRVSASPRKFLGISRGPIAQVSTADGEFLFTDHIGSKNQSPYTLIAMRHPISAPFNITREGKMARVGKKLGLVKELEIGIKHLDEAFLIQMEDNSRNRSFLMQNQFHGVLEAILEINSFVELRGITSGVKSTFGNDSLICLELYGTINRVTEDEASKSIKVLKMMSEALREVG